MGAAFFDMDRTVLRIDTGMSWMKFLHRRGELSRLGLARAVYWSALYKVALLDMESLGATKEFIAANELLDPESPDALLDPIAKRGLAKSWARGRAAIAGRWGHVADRP